MDKRLIGKTCPYCKTPFQEGDVVVFCSTCEMPHHLACWTENQGCTTFGCTGGIGETIDGSTAANTSATHTYSAPVISADVARPSQQPIITPPVRPVVPPVENP